MAMEQMDNQNTLVENLRTIKMAFPRYFRNNAFDVRDEGIAAVLALLEKGTIQCACQKFEPVKASAELQAQAKRLAEVLRQSSYVLALRNALHVYSGYQFDLFGTIHSALYYPEIKLYAYTGYLTPKTLLDLLAKPECEQVAVFTGMAKWGRRNHYLLFRRTGAWEEYTLAQNPEDPELAPETEIKESMRPCTAIK
jgi:hypothetical protein